MPKWLMRTSSEELLALFFPVIQHNEERRFQLSMDQEATYNPDFSHPYLQGGALGAPILKVVTGSLRGNTYPLTNAEYSIGRDPGSDIVVAEKKVSRRHAKIVKGDNRWELSDLQSTNGIYVNNLKLNKANLYHGDTFQIGSCLFQFVVVTSSLTQEP